MVGTSGAVIGIDRSPQAIAVAKERARAPGFRSARFYVYSVEAVSRDVCGALRIQWDAGTERDGEGVRGAGGVNRTTRGRCRPSRVLMENFFVSPTWQIENKSSKWLPRSGWKTTEHQAYDVAP